MGSASAPRALGGLQNAAHCGAGAVNCAVDLAKGRESGGLPGADTPPCWGVWRVPGPGRAGMGRVELGSGPGPGNWEGGKETNGILFWEAFLLCRVLWDGLGESEPHPLTPSLAWAGGGQLGCGGEPISQ